MAVREIKTYPEKVLKQKAAPVENIDRELQRLIDDMIETMYAAPGIGLAAPQVGVSKRLIVIDVSRKEEEKTPLIVLINPVMKEADGEMESEEGCLSLPGYITTVKRAERVLVQGLDREGRPVQIEGEGVLCRALQHEIDHLNGTLLIDRISSIKREFFKKRFQKALSKA
ncbi:MAG: peptide deformylase [Nitrospirae bacterium]|nr:peptide deformylase [Nitrospirota bacterium]MCL5421621.1 peptide deformylase [Nitrospirota bacterium]